MLMRNTLTIALLCSLMAVAAAQEKKPATDIPDKGDRVIVRGCLSGAVLEASETKVADATGHLAAAVTFRLTGDKGLLKRMRKDHNGKVVEITGILKSNLPQGDARRGKTIGNTRIVVGVGTPHSRQPEGPPSLPVLEVKSYEAMPASCGG
jgi:hypothetical protein